MHNDTTRRWRGGTSNMRQALENPFAEEGEGPRCQRRHRPLPVVPEDAESFHDVYSPGRVARR